MSVLHFSLGRLVGVIALVGLDENKGAILLFKNADMEK